jgi:hypothetical protein
MALLVEGIARGQQEGDDVIVDDLHDKA